MNNRAFLKIAIPVYLASFVSWFYYMIFTPLAYIYNTYPGQDNLVMLVAELPGFVAMFSALAASALINKIGNKPMALISLVTLLLGGLIARYLGSVSLRAAIIGSGVTGIAAGALPTVTTTVLAETAPEKLRDKVIGWNDLILSTGMLVSSAAAGFLAKGGNWEKSFDIYWIIVPIILLTILWFPHVQPEAPASAAAGTEGPSRVNIPRYFVWLLILKFFTGFFTMGRQTFGSALIITEYGLGDSALVGISNSISVAAIMVVAIFVFAWLRVFKKYSSLISLLLIGATMVAITAVPSIINIVLMTALTSAGISTYHSGMGTAVSMGAKGRAIGIVNGLFIAVSLSGESLCGYAAPALANMVYGTTSPSACIKVCGFACILCALISYPFFSKVFKDAFPENGGKA